MIELSAKELKNYSLARAISAATYRSPERAGLEAEVSRARFSEYRHLEGDRHEIYVPRQVLAQAMQQRDMTAAGVSGSNYLVATEQMGFVEMLRNRAVTATLGVEVVEGLTSNVAMPKQTAASTWYWLADETTAITESQPTFGQISMIPKTGGAYVEVSRQLTVQSTPTVERVIANDLLAVAATALDSAVLYGSGAAGQPTGIVNTGGIGTVTGTSIDYAKIVEFQSDILANNVYAQKPGFATTPAVAALLKARVKLASTWSPIWDGALAGGSIDGSPAIASAQMASATMLFGDWSTVLVGLWGDGIEVAVNPYAGFPTGTIGMRVMLRMDVAVRRPGAFSYATSIT